MFTGIIEEVGTVRTVQPLDGGRAFEISAIRVLDGIRLGDSVSVDGACHTVTAIGADHFSIQSVATTLGRTTLGGFAPGRRVNLERAMLLSDRLGGHLVQGHVDDIGTIVSIRPVAEHVLIDLTLPPVIEEVTILHGSIALNGISLTVNDLPAPGCAQVSIIPHTWEVTTLSDLTAGSTVNVEGDLIGKYVRNLLQHRNAAR